MLKSAFFLPTYFITYICHPNKSIMDLILQLTIWKILYILFFTFKSCCSHNLVTAYCFYSCPATWTFSFTLNYVLVLRWLLTILLHPINCLRSVFLWNAMICKAENTASNVWSILRMFHSFSIMFLTHLVMSGCVKEIGNHSFLSLFPS